MRKKDYDDDLLIELLADPQHTRKEIAERLGLSRRMLHGIIKGDYRKDLQPRIREAHSARASRQRRPALCKVVRRTESYDDAELVEMLARGDRSTREIAAHFGLSRDMVWRIATGRRRPDLYKRVQELAEEALMRAQHQAAASLAELLEQHIEVGLTGDGETARKCREFVLDRFLLGAPRRPRAAAGR